MGSSSSRPQQQYYYYPQGGYPAQEPYAHTYTRPSQGQFGYYYQQVGNDPSQVRAIPGYYYPPAQHSHRRHNSAPGLSNSQRHSPQRAEHATQAAAPSGSSPAAAPSPVQPTEAPADPGPSEAPPPQEAGAPDGAPPVPEKEPEPTLQPEPAPEPEPEPMPELVTGPVPAHLAPGISNPLPAPPQDVLEREAYRHLRRTQTTGPTGPWGYYGAPVASVSYKPQLRSQYRPKRVESLKPPRPHKELRREEKKSNGGGGGAFKLLRSFTLPGTANKAKKLKHSPPLYYQPGMAYLPSRSGSLGSNPLLATAGPPPLSGPPVIVRLDSPLNPTSRHKILYKKKLYPSAAHLFEAHKFLKYDPELAERIRSSSGNAVEMSMLSRAFEADGKARKDWPLVWRDKMDKVLYMKFTQHPDLRAELMSTGYAPLVDGNEPVRPDAEGVNELGKALVRLRERLRMEGAR